MEERGKRRTSPRHLPSGIPTPSSTPDPETYPPGSVLKLEQQRNSKLWTGSESQGMLHHEEQSCPVSTTQITELLSLVTIHTHKIAFLSTYMKAAM